MLVARALTFSIGVTVANWCAITLGAFVTTALQRGMTSHLVEQLFRIAGSMLLPGWLFVTAITTGFSLFGWLVARRASSASGGARWMIYALATGLVGLLPACLAFAVSSPAFVGLAIVLLVSGGAVAIAARNSVSLPGSTPPRETMSDVLTQRAVFGRRGL